MQLVIQQVYKEPPMDNTGEVQTFESISSQVEKKTLMKTRRKEVFYF
jgi:hypothetical protein